MGRWEYSDRGVIEDAVRIEIADLKTWGYSNGGGGGTLTTSRNGVKTGSLRFYVNIGYPVFEDDPEESYIEFSYNLNDEPVKYRHKIESLSCNYGNYRLYFNCKFCGSRVMALYLYSGYFACRHCHKLVYQRSRDHRSLFDLLHRSQNMKDRAKKLEERGHPRKANNLYWKAEELNNLSLQEAVRRFGKDIDI